MTQKAINYGIVLYQLGISQDMVEEIKALVDENLELADAAGKSGGRACRKAQSH